MANLNIAIEIFANDQASGPLGRVNSALGTVGKAGMVVAGGATAAAAGIIGLGAAGLSAASDMDSGMSDIAAVLGTTKDEIEPLGDLIKDLGVDPNLKVTATEAAAAIEMLARNGLGMTEILDGAANSTVLLANATGSSFDNAANIATDAMSIFEIEAENMQDAVNGIVSVTTNSKFTIDDFALALSQGGGVAAAAGVSFDDFNTTIAAISPLFKSGSDAGTSLKTMLTRLVPGSNAAADAMHDLGIIAFDNAKAMEFLNNAGVEVEGGVGAAQEAFYGYVNSLGMSSDAIQELVDSQGLMANQFYDSEGNLKSMAEISGVLQESLSGLSEQQKTQALQTIFGADAMRAAVALADTGEAAFADLADAMGQTDAVESAATRMDNLAGVMEILEGIGESLMLSIGQGLLPIFRLFADAALNLAEEIMPKIEAGLAAVSSVVEEVTGELQRSFEAGLGPVETMMEVLDNFLPEATINRIWEIIDGITAFKDRVVEFMTPIVEWIQSNVELKDVLTGLGIAVTVALIPPLLTLLGTILSIAAPIVAVIGVVALLRTAWENNWGGIQEKTAVVWEVIKGILNLVWTYVTEFVIPTYAMLWDKWVNVWWPAIQSTMESVWAVIEPIWIAIRDWVVDTLIPTIADLYDQWVNVWWPEIQTALENVWTIIEGVFEEIDRWINTNIIPWIEYLQEVWATTVWPAIQTAVEDFWAIVEPIWTSLKTWLEETLPPALEGLQTVFENVMEAIDTAVQPVKDLWDKFVEAVEGFWNWISNVEFKFNISIPDLPDWAVPGSPIPLHTAWKDFEQDMRTMQIAPRIELAGAALPPTAAPNQTTLPATAAPGQQVVNQYRNEVTIYDSVQGALLLDYLDRQMEQY